VIDKGGKTTLHSIVEREVQLGLMLHFNGWAGYNGLSQIGYFHGVQKMVNYSENFVDPR